MRSMIAGEPVGELALQGLVEGEPGARGVVVGHEHERAVGVRVAGLGDHVPGRLARPRPRGARGASRWRPRRRSAPRPRRRRRSRALGAAPPSAASPETAPAAAHRRDQRREAVEELLLVDGRARARRRSAASAIHSAPRRARPRTRRAARSAPSASTTSRRVSSSAARLDALGEHGVRSHEAAQPIGPPRELTLVLRPERSAPYPETRFRYYARPMPRGEDLGPLAGMRVLDFTRILSGPYATMLLADLGAEVIKVERPGAGDDTRAWGPPFSGGISTYFAAVNRGKRSVAIDLKREPGRELARRLAGEVDIVVENFRPGVGERLGLAYEQLADQNPGLVYASINGFGSTRPARRRRGHRGDRRGRDGADGDDGHARRAAGALRRRDGRHRDRDGAGERRARGAAGARAHRPRAPARVPAVRDGLQLPRDRDRLRQRRPGEPAGTLGQRPPVDRPLRRVPGR